MYVITAASGKIGKSLSAALLAAGKQVRVIGRSAEHLKELTDKGAEPMIGDVSDPDFVNRAFEGGTAVFCLIPPSYDSTDFRTHQNQVARNYADAVKKNNIKYAVLLSSVGAHLRKGAGVVDGLGEMEEDFLKLKDVNVVNLRPSYFMENIYGQLDMIKNMGIMGSAVKSDLPVPMVATKDIAATAFNVMKDLSFKGNTVHYVLGPRDFTWAEVASVIGKAIGKPDLKYVQFSYEDAKNGMVKSGMLSADMADLFNQLSESFNTGKAGNAHHRDAENTTPTTLEEFAQGVAAAFRQ